PFDADNLDLLADAVPIAENVTFLSNYSRSFCTVSPDGKLLYRTGESRSGSRVMVFDSTGRVVDSVGDWIRQYNVQLSPDERFLAVSTLDESSGSGQVDVWIHDLSRRIKRRVTFDSLDNTTPVWSPDGESFAFVTIGGDSTTLAIGAANGIGAPRVIFTSRERMFVDDWSADGRYIFVNRSFATNEIWVAPLDTTEEPFNVCGSGQEFGWPALSPDGRWLAFMSLESGEEEVYVIPFPTGNGKWQVSLNEGDRPRWSADGKRLYYLDNNETINVAEVDGSGVAFKVGDVHPLFSIRGARPGNVYDVNADGSLFYVNQLPADAQRSVPLTLVQNWDAALTR
ncbi:MAG TPA: hypothetical protein VLB27_09020, partial [candidate division Zixibacteria bacterium]|nr:hypothetical protein [candidate division Zixibacteria bacterium]